MSARSATGSSVSTPSMGGLPSALHIFDASAAWVGKIGDDARLRHSWFGCSHPQRFPKSPVNVTAPGGNAYSTVGVIGARSNEPSRTVSTPTERNVPDPTRISLLFAAKTRYVLGPRRNTAMPRAASELR